MNILTGYDFGNKGLAEYDAFFRGRALTSIYKIPFSHLIDMSTVEDMVYDKICKREIEIDYESPHVIENIANHIESEVKKRSREMKRIIGRPVIGAEPALLDAIWKTIFCRNFLEVTYQGIESEITYTIMPGVEVIQLTEVLSERGKTLSRVSAFSKTYASRHLLAPAPGLLQTHTRLLYQQFWEIIIDDVNYNVIAYKNEIEDGVIIYNETGTFGVYPLTEFTENWTDLIGSR